MKLIKTVNDGYINPNLIECYKVSMTDVPNINTKVDTYDVIAYPPATSEGIYENHYVLARCKTEVEAQKRLEELVTLLAIST